MTASNHSHLSIYTLLSELTVIICGTLFFFTPFSLSAASLPFFCLSVVCFAGIGSGSSPSSSQSEALPPSTDWPVSGYTSSFSLSSPEMDDTGTLVCANPSLRSPAEFLVTAAPEPQPSAGEL